MPKSPLTLIELNGRTATIRCNKCHKPFNHVFPEEVTTIKQVRARLMFSVRDIHCSNPRCGK